MHFTLIENRTELRRECPASPDSPFRLPPQGVRLDALEKDLIRQALERHQGNRTRASKDLGLTRNTLLYRMQKHGLR